LIPELANVFKVQHHKSTFTQDDDFVFARVDGSPYDPDHLRNVVLYPALERARIERSAREFGFHIFRHSAASIVHAETHDIKLAQELLGHARISTTSDIYVHVSEVVAEEAVKILAREVNWPLIVPQESEQIQ
jgi:integrase